jgi:hypothetical protein
VFVATTRRATAVLAAALAASIPLAAITGSPAHATAPSLYVVAVGDSYASGQGAKGSGWTNDIYERSALAAPQQAAAQLSAVEPTVFASQACSGSIIEDPSGQTDAAHRLLGPSGQLSQVGVPGQRVDGLTLSIGGNDIGFASIVENCASPLDECENRSCRYRPARSQPRRAARQARRPRQRGAGARSTRAGRRPQRVRH